MLEHPLNGMNVLIQTVFLIWGELGRFVGRNGRRTCNVRSFYGHLVNALVWRFVAKSERVLDVEITILDVIVRSGESVDGASALVNGPIFQRASDDAFPASVELVT